MKNFVAVGSRLTITAGSAISSGDGVLQGSLFGVAETDIANGEEGNLLVTGMFDLTKVGSQAWTVGTKVYWDGSACTTDDATGSNPLIGVAAAAVGSGAVETTGRVRLNGAAV